MNDQIQAQAQIIAEKLNDVRAIGFHYNAVKQLGFQRCYELCSLTLQIKREGKVKGSVARYYNGCVKKEIRRQF